MASSTVTSRSVFVWGKPADWISVANSANARAASRALSARTVRCTRRTDSSSKRPALTVSFHTPGRTSTFEPVPLAARLFRGRFAG
jgi:hypothetical protein